MASADASAALGAYQALIEVSRSDIRYVQEAAAEALGGAAVSPHPAELHFGNVSTPALPVTKTIRLGGPPLAAAVTVAQTEAWLTASVEPPEVTVSIDTVKTGHLSGSVTLAGPTGHVVIPVTAEVVAAESVTAAAGPAPVVAPLPAADRQESVPPALGAGTRGPSPPAEPSLAAVPLRGGTSGPPESVEAEPAEVRTTQQLEEPAASGTSARQEAPAPGAPTGPGSSSRQYWKRSGITALVSAGLMLLCIVLPQVGEEETYKWDGIKAIYLLYLGLVVLGLGTLALRARWRIQGLGGLIGASTIGTVVAFDMLNTFGYRLEGADLGLGFFVGFVAPFVLIAAGILAVVAARRESDLGFAAVSRSDWAAWAVIALAAAGAVTVLPSALETYASYKGWGLQGLWVAVLTLWVPVAAVLARPVVLGRWMLLGWCLGCVAPVVATWLAWDDYDETSHGMWFVMLTLIAMAGLAPMVHRDRSQARGA
jgi:hypothetical protein